MKHCHELPVDIAAGREEIDSIEGDGLALQEICDQARDIFEVVDTQALKRCVSEQRSVVDHEPHTSRRRSVLNDLLIRIRVAAFRASSGS